MTSFIAAISVGTEWASVLWVICVLSSVLFLCTGIILLYREVRKRINQVEFIDDWRCTYFKSRNRLQITGWITNPMEAERFIVKSYADWGYGLCCLRLQNLGGFYFQRQGGLPDPYKPMMELYSDNVNLNDRTSIELQVVVKAVNYWGEKRMNKTLKVTMHD